MRAIIYHLVPKDYWEASPRDQPYKPVDYDREGFIHCTAGEEQLAVVANRYYRHDQRTWLALTIDVALVSVEINYEPGGDGLLYPHLYGLLNRDAVIKVQHMPRDPDGTFKPPLGRS